MGWCVPRHDGDTTVSFHQTTDDIIFHPAVDRYDMIRGMIRRVFCHIFSTDAADGVCRENVFFQPFYCLISIFRYIRDNRAAGAVVANITHQLSGVDPADTDDMILLLPISEYAITTL